MTRAAKSENPGSPQIRDLVVDNIIASLWLSTLYNTN